MGYCLVIVKHPTRPDCSITLPDDWLYEHEIRRNEAVKKAQDNGLPPSLVSLAATLALLDDWSGIPGIPAQLEAWELHKTPIAIGEWMKKTTHESFSQAYEVPPN